MNALPGATAPSYPDRICPGNGNNTIAVQRGHAKKVLLESMFGLTAGSRALQVLLEGESPSLRRERHSQLYQAR